MSKGKIKFYNPAKGFGVIIDLETKQELHVENNDVSLEEGSFLKGGQAVQFEIGKGHDNLKAIKVIPIEDQESKWNNE